MDDPQFAIGFYLVFLLSVTAHEAAHAWSAMRLGDHTAYLAGQVTLDPLPHIRREPFGMVVLPAISVFAIGFPLGFAHAPYDPFWAIRYPKRAAWMALAGPGANLIIATLAAIGLKVGLSTGYFEPNYGATKLLLARGASEGVAVALATFASLTFFMNLLLRVFNLIPVPPLDGSGALPLILPGKTMRKVNGFFDQPWAGMAGLMFAWLTISRLFWPIFDSAVRTLFGIG